MFKFFALVLASITAFWGSLFGLHETTTIPAETTPEIQTNMPSVPPILNNRIIGIVKKVSGDIITVSGKYQSATATSTYNVNAKEAKIIKTSTGSPISVTEVKIGDTLSISGTLSGTSMQASIIFDGKIPVPVITSKASVSAKEQSHLQGVRGTVTSIAASVININVPGYAGQSSEYTVNASQATIRNVSKPNATLSDISVGDIVIVQGVFNGNSITAQIIIDGLPK